MFTKNQFFQTIQTICTDRKKGSKYIIVGGLAAGIDFLCMKLFVEGLNVHRLLSTICAFVISVSCAFIGQKYITFAHHYGYIVYQGQMFLLFQFLSIGTGIIIMGLCIDIIGIERQWGRVVAKGGAFLQNYILNSLFTFSTIGGKNFRLSFLHSMKKKR